MAAEVEQAETGSIRLALTARGASGALYRLRQGTFLVEQISGGGGSQPLPDPGVPQPGPVPPPRSLPPSGAPDRPVIPPGVGMGGAPAEGGSAGAPMAGSAGSVGTAGASMGGTGIAGTGGAGTAGAGSGGVATFLFTEDDPFATTLETNLPTGLFAVTLFDGWFLERVQGGEVSVVDARLASPVTQEVFILPNEESFVSYRFETQGDVVDFGTGRLIVDIEVDEGGGGTQPDPRRSVMENDIGALAFSLEETLAAALANAGSSLGALDAYHGIIDSYATAADGREPTALHCDDELTNGAPSLNGFPLQCGRLEAQQFDNIGAWFPTAAVNRLDLAPADGEHCGQQRLIFANNAAIGSSRMLIILESQIPNPDPSCGVAACAPIAEFWVRLGQISDPAERAELLREAFLTGSPELVARGFGPFMNAAQLGPNGGQVRTNNFNDAPWTLREFQFVDIAAPPVPVPVAEAPHGALWNDLSDLPQGDACRESFLRAAELGLLTDNLSAMSFPVDEACKDAESRNDFSQDYASHLGSGSGDFIARLDQLGAPFGLTAFDLAARARFAGSCIGCHMESGGAFLGNGVTAPFQFDFVHVNEFLLESCGDGGLCFGISEGLRNEFLPHRARVTERLLSSGPSCGEPVEPELPSPPIDVPPPVEGVSMGGGPSQPPRVAQLPSGGAAGEVRYTIGGQLVDSHPH